MACRLLFYIGMPNRPGRLKGFEYVGFVTYFVTTCTEKHLRAFDDVEFGRWAVAQLLRQASLRKFEVSAYCLMPDHVHLLLRGRSDDADLRSFIISWNTRTAFCWRRQHHSQLWQKGYYDRVLRDSDDFFGIARYILRNPVEAGLVTRPEDYALSGTTGYTMREFLYDD
jgi:putative transposase